MRDVNLCSQCSAFLQSLAFITVSFFLFIFYIMVIIQRNSAFLDDLFCGSKIQDQEGEPRRTLSFWLQGSVTLNLRSVYHLKEHSTYSHLFSTNLQFSYSQCLTPASQRLFCKSYFIIYCSKLPNVSDGISRYFKKYLWMTSTIVDVQKHYGTKHPTIILPWYISKKIW